MEFRESFKAALRVSTPLLAVRTFDARATIANITAILETSKNGTGADAQPLWDVTGVMAWDICHGVRGINKRGETAVSEMLSNAGAQQLATQVAAECYRIAEFMPADCILFIHNAHDFWKDATERQGIWNLRDALKSRGSMLVLLAAPGAELPAELAQDVMVLEEPLPTPEQIKATLTKAHKAAKSHNKEIADLSADAIDKGTRALTGLAPFPGEQSAQMCLNPKTGVLDIAGLWDRKKQIIRATPGLEMYEGTATLANVGGNVNVIKYLNAILTGPDRPNIVLRFDEMEKAFAGAGTDTSGDTTKLVGSILTWMQDRKVDGTSFIGVSGCCKSELLFAWANDAGLPVITVNLPAMQGSLVGQSIANLTHAQKVIDSIGGGKVLAIATINDVSTLPAPLLRRFSPTFFFDVPTDGEKADILRIQKALKGIKDGSIRDMRGWTGADIENACKNAKKLNIPLEQAAGYVVPVMRARAAEMDALRQAAGNRYISAAHEGLYVYSPIDMADVPKMPVVTDGRALRTVN